MRQHRDRADNVSKPLPNSVRQHGARLVSAFRLHSGGASRENEQCRVVEEAVLTIDIEGLGSYTLMWTPTEEAQSAAAFTLADGVLADTDNPERLALAVGFAFTEGIIAGLQDIASLAVCPDRPEIVRMRLTDPTRVRARRRNVVMMSSCGVCGGREEVEQGLQGVSPVAKTLRLDAADFPRLMAAMGGRQAVFITTGGTHAAAIFSRERRILAAAEDLGRHNALDKTIGKCLLQGQGLAGCGVVLSSRLSQEMVAKAARAGLEIVAAVSAPSSLAIELAERYGITLCGFVRGASAVVYTHPARISDLDSVVEPAEARPNRPDKRDRAPLAQVPYGIPLAGLATS